MRIGGWQRIGIVASVTWAIGAAWVQSGYDKQHADDAFRSRYNMCRDAEDRPVKLDSEGLDSDDFDCMEKGVKAYNRQREDDLHNVAITALVPIPIALVAAYLLIGIVRWVRSGFRQDENSS